MAILTVLFATSIVLKSFSGLLYSFRALFDFLLLYVLNFSISSGLNEKYATSEPDMRADPKRRIISINSPIIILKSGALTAMPERNDIMESGYSGSNGVFFNKAS
jgi:hypothetical protein